MPNKTVQKYGSNVVHKLGIPTQIRADGVVTNFIPSSNDGGFSDYKDYKDYKTPATVSAGVNVSALQQNEVQGVGANNIVASSPSKAQVRKVTNYSRAKDFTSRDA